MPDEPSIPATPTVATAFAALHPGVQRQLWRMKWTHLRPLQVAAIGAFAAGDEPLVLAAATATGKTEAAFLPVLSAIAAEPGGSVRALYVGPLKALINDQFARVEELCGHLEVPVHRWHGDVPAAQKERLVKSPAGVLLITPESLESLFVNRSGSLPRLLGGLRYVVIDELHSFLDNERGLHLRSLLCRARGIAEGTGFRTIGLSATLGDFAVARRYLEADRPDRVRVLESDEGGRETRYRVHGYRVPATLDPDDESADPALDPVRRTADDIVRHCAGAANLVFASRKADVEEYADLCRQIAADRRLPDRFLVHHGSLSADLRVEAEEVMKGGAVATTFCSSTLEMGVDIGSVRSVGQVGPPSSVASLKQRLGRSGRRADDPRVMRVYVHCREPAAADDVFDRLHLDLIQVVALTELMLQGWVEPPVAPVCDLSTLAQQVISVVAETGGLPAADLYNRLCARGAFGDVEPRLFAALLRQLGAKDVVEQVEGGDLILGLLGERLRRHRGFYAVFPTPEEYTLMHAGCVLGSLEVLADGGYRPNDHLLFAGRRWRITDVDDERLVIYLVPAGGRKRARFGGTAGDVHGTVREAMRDVLAGTGRPVYLDAEAADLLAEARAAAAAAGFLRRGLVPLGSRRTAVLTWAGAKAQRTLAALLAAVGADVASDHGIGLVLDCGEDAARGFVSGALGAEVPPEVLGSLCRRPQARKYDWLLGDDLVAVATTRGYLESEAARAVLRHIAASSWGS